MVMKLLIIFEFNDPVSSRNKAAVKAFEVIIKIIVYLPYLLIGKDYLVKGRGDRINI